MGGSMSQHEAMIRWFQQVTLLCGDCQREIEDGELRVTFCDTHHENRVGDGPTSDQNGKGPRYVRDARFGPQAVAAAIEGA